MKIMINLLLLLLMTGLVNCGSDDGGADLPANLSFDVTIEGTLNDMVRVSATADNASFYRIDFGDGAPTVDSNSGNFSHFYEASGTYTITVQAHASESAFISDSEPVVIEILDPTQAGYESPLTYDGYELVWQDEFEDGISDDWTFEIGDGCPDLCGWGNNELEYYREENASVENGWLKITAKSESFGGRGYTSSRMITKGKQSFVYGRIDIRAILPEGQGLWPALWMLGENIDEVGWPKCGEIDIMEMVGGNNRENTVHGTTHWDNGGSYASYGGDVTKNEGTFGDSWHVFSIIWDSEEIIWLVDNQQFHVIDITPSGLSEFHLPHFLIFNVAVGGNWPGNPDGTTVFPQEMLVDYVRVFQEN